MNFHALLLGIMDVLSRVGWVSISRRKQNYQKNLERIAAHYTCGYVEDQRQWRDVSFGLSTMAFSGCEIFAVYNALLYLHGHPGHRTLADLIYHFEGKGAMLQGGFGTSPYALRDYFISKGYVVNATISDDSTQIRKLEKKNAVYLLTAFNEGHNIFKQIHTVCITFEQDGWQMHNNGKKNTHGRYVASPYASLEQAVQKMRSNSRLIYLMAISKE